MKTTKLKIGVVASTIFPGGGLVHFLKQAIRALSRSRADWEFTIIASIALRNQIQVPAANVKICFWDSNPLSRLSLRMVSAVLASLGKSGDASYLLQSRFDRYHLPWGNLALLKKLLSSQDVLWIPYYNIALGKLSLHHLIDPVSRPALLTIHDVHPALYLEDYPPEQIYRFYHQFGQFAAQCSRVVTHSRFQSSAIQQTLGIEGERITVTPQPPLHDPAELLKAVGQVGAARVLKRFGIEGRYAFYPASTLHTHKNHTRLLVAWSRVKQHLGPDCPLLVFTYRGNRAQAEGITALIKALQLQDQVRFTGLIDNQTLAVLFQNCSLVVVPTLFEGAGSGILTDAMTVGKPVACSRIPPILEQLETFAGVSVCLFDPLSVPDIAAVVERSWNTLDEMKAVATTNQQIILQRFPNAWSEWADFHTELMLEVRR